MKKEVELLVAQAVKKLPDSLQTSTCEQVTAYLTKLDEQAIQYPDEKAFYENLVHAFALSQFLVVNADKYPQFLVHLYLSKRLFISATKVDYAADFRGALHPQDDEAIIMRKLRELRTKIFMRICMRDILGLADLQETVTDLSNFADVCIDATTQWLYQKLADEYGYPTNDRNLKQELLVIAVGKLGMSELNFSSDVDLVFCYPSLGMTNGDNAISNERFFTLLVQRLVQVLSANTEYGFVFRVDLRLRPYGTQGTLVLTFDALQKYYRDAGRDWERFALAKARVISGEFRREDLLKIIYEFVYRPYLDFSVIEALANMQVMIHREIIAHNDDIKRGIGGIREIEFIVQVFQLIHGGKYAWLKDTSLLAMLPKFSQYNLLTAKVVAYILKAYKFLRTIEHRLQQYRDQQTQLLPKEEVDQTRLAFALNYSSYDDFLVELKTIRKKVHAHFDNVIMLPTKAPETAIVTSDDSFIKAFLEKRDEQLAQDLLVSLGYQ
ncbi:MAG: bifunctional glutamine synthetase adenylyltransferase/deadenyltransferase, partial [Pseudomonadota bacterium]